MKDKRTLIYISHPFSADPETNRKHARKITARLARKCGTNLYIFINPLDLFLGQSQSFEQDSWVLSQAIEIMLRCDGVIFCDGWRKSRGCRMEHFKARAAGLPRWIGVDAFLGNLRQQNEGYKRFEMLMFEQMIAEGKMRRGHPEDLSGGKCTGRSDEVGGFHDEGLGWSPDGNFCGECSNGTCAACPVAEDELKEAAL